LGFLYKTLQKVCDTDIAKNRQAFQTYYATLGKLISLPLILPDKITFPEEITAPQAAQHLIRLSQNLDQSFPPLDSFLFYTITSRTFPILEGYATANYLPPAANKAVSFPDCMENSIANFIRIMSYDVVTTTYSADTLAKNLGITLSAAARARLEPFFKNVMDHSVWTQLVSNIPYVPYLQSTQKLGKGNRYIRITSPSQQKEFEAQGYDVVPDGHACFELRPSIRTLIMVLSYVLDLNLFENPLEKEALRSDLVAHYFPLLCEKLHLQGQCSLEASFEEDDDDSDSEEEEGEEEKASEKNKPSPINLDEIDYAGEKDLYALAKNKFVDLGNKEGLHQFKTSVEHGEYDFEYKGSVELLEKIAQLTKNNIASFAHNVLTVFLFSQALERLINTSLLTFDTIFALPLYNSDYVFDFVGKYLYQFPLIYPTQPRSISLFYNIATNQADRARTFSFFMSLTHIDDQEKIEAMKKLALSAISDPHASEMAFENAAFLLCLLEKNKKIEFSADLLLDDTQLKTENDFELIFYKATTSLGEAPPDFIMSLILLYSTIIKNLVKKEKERYGDKAQLPQTIINFILKNSLSKKYPSQFFLRLLYDLYVIKSITLDQTVEYIIKLVHEGGIEKSSYLRGLINILLRNGQESLDEATQKTLMSLR